MRIDDVVTRLTACGLPEKDARAFAHLTKLGLSKVTDVAKAAGLKRAETYQVLERLQSRGLVEGTLERPRQFSAVAPERAVDVLVAEREKALRDVESMREDLSEKLGQLSGGATSDAGVDAFRVLHDRNQIVGQLGRTLRAAESELCVVASGRALYKLLLDEGLEKEFRAAQKRGVALRVLTEILPGQDEIASLLQKFAQVRHFMVPRPLRFVVADEREIVQYVTADPTGGAKETALWLGARDHVQAQRAFFDDLWTAAMPIETRVDELATGRAGGQVVVVKGRFTRTEREKEMLLRAERDIALVLSADEAARLTQSGLSRVLASRIKAGVRVRVLAPAGKKVTLEGAQVRVAEHERLPRALVDGAEALLVLPGSGDAKSLTSTDEFAVWATLAESVEILAAEFEREWSKAA